MDKETIISSLPRISIVIPTLHEGPFLERTLKNFDSLQIPHELIITDGGSTDETLTVARKYTDKITVWGEPRRQTFGEAKNAGVALATGEFIVCIDADVIIPEPQAFFTEMLSAFNKNSKLVAMTVPLQPFIENTSVVDRIFSAPLNWFYIISNNVFHSGNSSGEFQMVRTEIFRKIGGFSEHLAAGEDNELFRQLATQGRTMSYSKLCVRHSLRRPHKLGWLRTYGIWIKNGLSVALRGKAAYKEWSVVR
jgi:glycosyltransferase involved in cell wall biosynthesis